MRWRFVPFYLLLIFSFWLLIFRLVDLMIVRGGHYRELSENNRIREEPVKAPRGIIYDRKGEVLVRNIPVFKKKEANGKFRVLRREEALALEAAGGTGAGELKTDLAREYPFGSLLAHILGYTGEITPEEVKEGARSGDVVGRTGVEEQYEKILRGFEGKELIEVDALGEKIVTFGQIPPRPGQNLTLALDLSLQKSAVSALKDQKGVVLVSNPNTGEILSLYSSPSFDPNYIDDKTLNNPDRPMFNRAIAGLYPPGSTFKIITASAGLETGKITAKTQIEDTGEIVIGPYRYTNWYWTQYGGKDGLLNVVEAIKRSNDIFFYRAGELVGIANLKIWADKFGVEGSLGIDLPGEASGVMPTPDWRKKIRGTEWFLGDTYHVAIGQGDLQVTPLQVNFWTAVIANGGKLCKPRILKWVIGSGKYKEETECKDIGLKKETVELIKEGMRQACAPEGTGWPLFNFEVKTRTGEVRKVETACKTGTAEFGDPQGRNHAWFTVFAPVLEPEVTVTVLVEGGGEGSSIAAPIAKEVLEEWFSR